MTAPVRHVHHGRLCWCVPGAFGFPLRFRRRRDAVRYQRTNLRLMAAAEQRLRRFAESAAEALKRLQEYGRPR
jgi:hypothetical protein